MIRPLYHHRRYIWQAAWNDFRYRYADTGLGMFWNVINPLLEVLIYTFVFTQILVSRGEVQGMPYVLYLCAGLFPWISFVETVIQGSNALTENASYLKRLALPPEIFVAKNVVLATLNFTIVLVLLLFFNLLMGVSPKWSWLLVPVVALLFQMMGFGLALGVAGLRVLFPDIGQILRTLLGLWKWTMPIIYPITLMPELVHPWLNLNPPYVFIAAIRNLFFTRQGLTWLTWLLMITWSVLFLLVGMVLMRLLRREIRDNL